jgi:hypothetical protein
MRRFADLYPFMSRQISQVRAHDSKAKGDKIGCSAGGLPTAELRDQTQYSAQEAIPHGVNPRCKKHNSGSRRMLNEMNMALVEQDKGSFAYTDKEPYQYAAKKKPRSNTQLLRAVVR